MNIVFFTHPAFLKSQSMPRFAGMLASGMRELGHTVEVVAPQAKFYNIKVPSALKKWMGYIDQYVLFPSEIRKKLKNYPANTIFVFADNALGPWVPLVADRPHAIHCHDFLAQRSALGLISENITQWSGRKYQAFIRAGYTKGKYFISVSEKTKQDLSTFLTEEPIVSEVVYNGLKPVTLNFTAEEARARLIQKLQIDLSNGHIMHIGGNQWYKNRVGVIEIYNAWRNANNIAMPLLMIGAKPSDKLLSVWQKSIYKDEIHLLTNIDDEYVNYAYKSAAAFLYPSLAEGFGWPIAEAMANGCPVITTNEAPMTEVAGKAAFYISRKTQNDAQWANDAAVVLQKVISLSPDEREKALENGYENIKRFTANDFMIKIENIYKMILSKKQ